MTGFVLFFMLTIVSHINEVFLKKVKFFVKKFILSTENCFQISFRFRKFESGNPANIFV